MRAGRKVETMTQAYYEQEEAQLEIIGRVIEAVEADQKPVSERIVVRSCSIRCVEHPEWGTWGVVEDHGRWFDIRGRGGDRVLFKSECDKFWEIVEAVPCRKAGASC